RIFLVALFVTAAAGAWLYLRWLEQSYQPPNYNLIEEGLYLGGHVPAPPAGTDAVLNLCEISDPYQCDPHRSEPITDGEPVPDLKWLQEMVQYIDAERQAGKAVYVHCRNGVSRSGMVVTAYLMSKHHWGRDQALAFVRSKRPITRPNESFMALLLQWEKSVLVASER